ncbi:hypothetical protein pEaSNUABM5_00328 [Erwinia phage pEa_SNUABM_5]|uniref:Uncharacterized protein n=1 Tax=Erwinia phage pEa_SNUABM_5 TaxID=2797313 RepID=A0A7T8EPT3_9CAUD|nr:hypothetical protein MPK73_gp328 [Erwinia phage pEa_SNUABM_5]QQO90470.1 hypothetical protein pEaSNUABM5_00328 [Erwinia phage pEa_SNUABM_5]
MPELRKPRPADKFSQARAAKNSPERQEAAAQKKISRGPKASGPRRNAMQLESPTKIRDEERVLNLVLFILRGWKQAKADSEASASQGIIKVSRKEIEIALRDLKNTRFTKIPTLINDVLVYNEIVAEFGQWVYVEHDHPDWMFILTPPSETLVTRCRIRRNKETGDLTQLIASEALLPVEDEYEEDEEKE